MNIKNKLNYILIKIIIHINLNYNTYQLKLRHILIKITIHNTLNYNT
jgi:hypothetical protein